MHEAKLLKKFIITGPESSGKTTIVQALCNQYGKSYRPEFARKFLSAKNERYALEDLTEIAKGQLAIENELVRLESDFIILDTDLLTIKIWSEVRFNFFNPNLSTILESYCLRHYLVCTPEIPWEVDPLREHPQKRAWLYSKYIEALDYYGFSYDVISGKTATQRIASAKHIITNNI